MIAHMVPYLGETGVSDEPVHKKQKKAAAHTEPDNRCMRPHRESLLAPETEPCSAVQPHPLGVKPLGNLYAARQVRANIKAHAGRFACLPDELLLDCLHHLNASELLSLGATCKALYAFCRHDETWRALFVEHAPDAFHWLGTWRSTYCGRPMNASISCLDLYSDALFRPHFCAHAPVETIIGNIPSHNEIARLSDLTEDQFVNEGWAKRPFILTDPVKKWPVYNEWSKQKLLEQHSKTCFRAEAVDWPFETYVDYMDTSEDESPLYLFDCRFVEKMALQPGDRVVRAGKKADYTPPAAFGSDLFNVLGADRPNDRWLIVGPPRSGSTFHKDPNGTSAWNAVITGSKYWLMFPSQVTKKDTITGESITERLPTPPGVFLSTDGSEVTSPLSIAEYMLSFHSEARMTAHCIEGICREGEVLHVPSGWFHLVLNLEESIALTQNFISETHLKDVLLFLRDTPEQISGFSSNIVCEHVFGNFVTRLKKTRPELTESVMNEVAAHDLQIKAKNDKSKWEALTSESAGGFSFGFADESGDDDIDRQSID